MAKGGASARLARWRKQLESYSELAGYPGPDIPGVDEVVGRGSMPHRPTDLRPGLIHGDFHFANVLFRHDQPRLAAIVDWELVHVGDPLLDLGHLLATWPSTRRRVVRRDSAGTRTADGGRRLVGRYAERTGRPVADVLWYRVLAATGWV